MFLNKNIENCTEINYIFIQKLAFYNNNTVMIIK